MRRAFALSRAAGANGVDGDWRTRQNRPRDRTEGITFANFVGRKCRGRKWGDDVPRSRSRQNFPRARVELLSDPLQGASGVPHPRRWTILWPRRISPLPPLPSPRPAHDARCNLYLITAGNILDLKSFPVKYRNIKGTSTAQRAARRARSVGGNDLPFMNSLRLPGRPGNSPPPRSCSHSSEPSSSPSPPRAPLSRTLRLSVDLVPRQRQLFPVPSAAPTLIPLIFLSFLLSLLSLTVWQRTIKRALEILSMIEDYLYCRCRVLR